MKPVYTVQEQMSNDYRVVEQAIIYLESSYKEQPSLDQIASSVGYSPYHFQRLFSRWVGISPKRFLQFLTKEHAKKLLEGSDSILEVAYRTGLSSPGRLHDLFITCEAVTPGEYKLRGEGLSIEYGFHCSPFGECLLALTDRGVCSLIFVTNGDRKEAFRYLRSKWKNASLVENCSETMTVMENLFPVDEKQLNVPLHLYLRGTNFQLKVWEALLSIPPARVVSYQDIAIGIGFPNALRAVGRAVAENPIPIIIPCHRVIRKSGNFGNYRYGSARKKALLGWEIAKGM